MASLCIYNADYGARTERGGAAYDTGAGENAPCQVIAMGGGNLVNAFPADKELGTQASAEVGAIIDGRHPMKETGGRNTAAVRDMRGQM